MYNNWFIVYSYLRFSLTPATIRHLTSIPIADYRPQSLTWHSCLLHATVSLQLFRSKWPSQIQLVSSIHAAASMKHAETSLQNLVPSSERPLYNDVLPTTSTIFYEFRMVTWQKCPLLQKLLSSPYSSKIYDFWYFINSLLFLSFHFYSVTFIILLLTCCHDIIIVTSIIICLYWLLHVDR